MNRALLAICIVALSAFVLTCKRKKRQRLIPGNQERVIILGCSSGIGRDIALQYASRGAKLILFARRKDLLDILKRECNTAGASDTISLPGDVTNLEDLNRAMAVSRNQLGGIDTVVYCAGVISVRPFLESCGVQVKNNGQGNQKVYQHTQDPHVVQQAMEHITKVNFYGAVQATQALLPLAIESSRSPNLVVVSSMAGKVGAPTRALYAASKHAVHGFFDSLRVEVEPLGVHITLACPGTVDTDLRHTAVDLRLGQGPAAGSSRHKLSPQAVARRIVDASDYQEREIYIPAWFGYAALWAKLLASSWVDMVAKYKYRPTNSPTT